jgi:DNA-binding transcriptional regulator YdaS (Cro superfamily)
MPSKKTPVLPPLLQSIPAVVQERALFVVIRYFGSQANLARYLGLHPGKISFWLNRAKTIPFHYALRMEEGVEGRVSRFDLAPYARFQHKKSGKKSA